MVFFQVSILRELECSEWILPKVYQSPLKVKANWKYQLKHSAKEELKPIVLFTFYSKN